MKKLVLNLMLALLFGSFFLGNAQAQSAKKPKAQGDSVVVNFGKGGRMVLHLSSPEDWEAAQEIDFNKIMADMQVLVDSARKTESGVITRSSEWGEISVYAEEEIVEQEDFDIKIDFEDGFRVAINNKKNSKEYKAPKHSNYTDFYFGLNSFLEDGSVPEGTPYDLRPAGSRYFEVAFRRQARIGGEKTRFFFNYALSFSWYNFMFEGNQMITEDQGQVDFVTNTDYQLDKSKLVAAYVNLPLMIKYRRKKFSLAAGGYIGYRLGSHSKIKYLDERGDWEKDKVHTRFGLEDFRYGLRAEINWIGPTFFAAYDFNDLFTEVSGAPKLNAFSFGIKL